MAIEIKQRQKRKKITSTKHRSTQFYVNRRRFKLKLRRYQRQIVIALQEKVLKEYQGKLGIYQSSKKKRLFCTKIMR